MRILRPALIGLFIAAVLGGGLVLFPEKIVERKPSLGNEVEQGELPHRKEYEKGPPRIRLIKVPQRREVSSGTSFPVHVVIENISAETLHALTVEERFDASFLSIEGGEHARTEKNVVRWTIPELRPNERWSGNYTMRLSKILPPGTIETTLIVTGDDLRGTPTSSRMTTSVLTVIPLPRTGREIPFPLRLLRPALSSALVLWLLPLAPHRAIF